MITADHKDLSENCVSRNNHQWIQSYPCKKQLYKKHREVCESSWSQIGSRKSVTLANPVEFCEACEDLSWKHCTSTPHRSETNGIVERAVRRVKEGTSAVLLQSGLNESRRADSMSCYTYLRNVTDLLTDGKTPYERRFGQPFKGPIFPFGSLVEYYPTSAKDQSRLHQFGKKVLLGLFFGYALYAGGIWKGDVLVADFEELETMDASEIFSKRPNAKEVIFPKHARLCRLKASVGLITCDTCVFCGLTWRATHSLPSVEGTGVLWVLTGTHPCGPPPRQDGGGTRAPALTYVHTVCVVLRARGRVCGRWFCGVSAVDSRTPRRTMSLALSFDLGCQVSNLCSQQQPNTLLLAMLLSSFSWTPTGSVDSASSSAGSSVFSLVRTLVLGDLNWWFSRWLCRHLFRGQLLLVLSEKLVYTVRNMLVDPTV